MARHAKAPLLTGGASAGLPGPARASAWQDLLRRSADLGPSRASRADVVLLLRDGARPTELLSWAATHRLAVDWSLGRRWAVLTGAPGRLGPALGVAVHDFRARSGRRFYASTSQPVLVQALGSAAIGVGRISSYGHPSMDLVPAGGLTPQGLLRAYDAQPLLAAGMTGAGQTVVFFEYDGFARSDLAAFARRFHLPPFHVTVDGGMAGSPQGESAMDIETVHSVAPGARLVYYNFSRPNDAGAYASAFREVAERYPGAVWSLSIGIGCDKAFSLTDLQVMDQAVADAEQHGTTAFVASGDTGGLDCTAPEDWGHNPTQAGRGVDALASLPSVTSVGGTALSVTGEGRYFGEETWSSPALSQGSGGGPSDVVPRPSWQQGRGVAPFGVYPAYREVPDVAAVADPATATAVIGGGQEVQEGGTSLSAPVWAGFTVLVDQYLEGQGQSPIGFANPLLYRLSNASPPYPPFHDVTVGGNDFYRATPGYDLVTGLGSPDVWNLVRDIRAAAGRQS